jgi:hypothetical protein
MLQVSSGNVYIPLSAATLLVTLCLPVEIWVLLVLITFGQTDSGVVAWRLLPYQVGEEKACFWRQTLLL